MARPAEKLIGRTAELGSLDAALAEAERRQACVVAVAGEPGMGKTRMLAELAARAVARRAVVLSGGASQLEGDLPFWVFVDALDEHVRDLEPRRVEELGAEARGDLAAVLPALRTPDGAPGPGPGERYRVHRAVRQLLETLATPRPLVLLLDDVHWADPDTVELLAALVRRPPEAGVLLALGLRPRQLPERLTTALERGEQAGSLVRIELPALSREEAGELLGDEVAEGVAAELYATSGGNPFYLQQLARVPLRGAGAGAGNGVALTGTDVPRAVAAALAEELALLSAAGRRLLEGAAVAGDPFEPELAAAAAGQEEGAGLDALDELLRRDLVCHADVPRRFRFRHPLVRGAVYEATPGGWRLGAHERCARVLADRGVPALERARHVERAARHGDLAAVAVLREAGEAAFASAPAAAGGRFRAALRLLAPDAPERAGLLRSLAAAHWATGEFAEAHAVIVESLVLLPEDAVAARVQLTAMCAGVEHLLGRHEAAHARLVAALGQLRDPEAPEAVPLLLHLTLDAYFRLDYAPMRRWAERSLAVARRAEARPAVAAAAALVALSRALCDAIPEAQAAYVLAAAHVDDLTDAELAAGLQMGGSSTVPAALELSRFREASAQAERTLAVARASGRGGMAPVLFWAGMTRSLLGRLEDAAELLDTAVEITRVSGNPSTQVWTLFGRSLIATAAGDVDTALAYAEESQALRAGLDDGLPTMWSGYALAAALLPTDQPERAIAVLLQAAGGEALPRFPPGWRPGALELLTRCRLALGRRAEAAAAAAEAEVQAAGLGLALPGLLAARAAAAVALEAGDPGTAAVRALASADAADAAGVVLEAARSRVLAGRALASAGEAERARDELLHAAHRFGTSGAIRLRDEAERELRKLGHRRIHRRSRAGEADGAGVATLTERELQVARLVVDRKTNAQIAAELFLSHKTVETHMRNLFHKLDVSSRVEVARAVERAEGRLREPAP